jgi:lipopolysaccharide transport system ATP-binding protein
MSFERPETLAVRIRQVSKVYDVYAQPLDRLKQFVFPTLARWFKQKPKDYFREFRALDQISLDIRRGETVGIIGRNGSGKSTLLQLVCGTVRPSVGQIEINGSVAALLELGAGFNPDFSGVDNVYLNASVMGLKHAQTQARFAQIEAFADIGDFIHQPVKTYSSGMVVRLAFAVIAHVDADVLIIDEALAVGDVYFTQKCMRFLKSFMARGTIFFVSHDIGAVKALCDRVVWLDGGQIKAVGDPKSVCQAYLENSFEAQQGLSTVVTATAPSTRLDGEPSIDAKRAPIQTGTPLDYLNLSAFDPLAAGFGKGGASIVHVGIYDEHGAARAWVTGGDPVCIKIDALCHTDLASPIIGFMVKDRLGQPLFGDNTYLTYADSPCAAGANATLEAQFEFDMPTLPVGEYSILVSIAEGSQAEHVHHHWIHDALTFRSETSSVTTGLIGIPMRRITISARIGNAIHGSQ